MNIVIIAFNYTYAGSVVNGPGMCLTNFVKILKTFDYKVSVYTELSPKESGIHSLRDKSSFIKDLKFADIVIHWSGLSNLCTIAAGLASNSQAKLLIGPNLIDTVELSKEQRYLKTVNFNKILTVNERLRFLISKAHNISLDKINLFLVGPDLDLWRPSKDDDGTILWKGNSRQFVKDIQFAIDLQNKLKGKYNFKFIGYPKPYDYYKHIESAKKSRLYISTSLSETMGLALVEQWCAGIPSITHPKIYMHGQNYKTGIITNKTINDYAEAIEEVMENHKLYNELSNGAIEFVEQTFEPEIIIKRFERVIL